MEIVKVENLYFGYQKKIKVINGVNISFYKSKFHIIAGPNGSGKTTLLRLIAGIYKNYDGSIKIKNDIFFEIKHLANKEISSLLSYIPSYIHTPFNFSVRDIILMGRRRFKGFFDYYDSFDFDIMNEFSKYVGINNILNKSFSEISTGERQLVLLVQGLVQDTPIILIDEPTSHLDPKHKVKIINILKELVFIKNKTVIAIMHDIRLKDFDCEHLIFMKNGKIVLNVDYSCIESRISDIANIYEINLNEINKIL